MGDREKEGIEREDEEKGKGDTAPLLKGSDVWVVHAERVREATEWTKRTAVLQVLMTVVCLVLSVYFYFACPKCLFGILIVSAIMCPFHHMMNGPLWVAIFMLVISGWTFTLGNLSLTWKSGMK
jgi:hypothetical protein